MINVVKQDLNFFVYPLWFQDIRNDGNGFVWKDKEGYEYRSGYKLPDKVDMVILLYLLLKSQTNNYQVDINITRREILIGCSLPTRDNRYYKRVEDSLKRWKNVSIEFHGTFYDNKRYISIGFGIIDNYKIDEDTKKVTVSFNKNWLIKIKQSNFFKYINFEYYKSLKRPVSRRMYEILSPKCYDGKEWHIRLTNLGNNLPIFKRKINTKDGEKDVMYASDVLVAIKPAFNDINRLAKSLDVAEKAKALPGDVFTVEYRITGEGQDRVIHIKTNRVELPKKENAPALPVVVDQQTQPMIERPIVKKQQPLQISEAKQEPDQTQVKYLEALKWLEAIPYFNAKRRDEISLIPMQDVVQCYPGIKQKYEELTKDGEKPGPGWVYKAFTEKWQFPDKTKPVFPETPQGKLSRQAKELFDSWDTAQQQKFLAKLYDYVVNQMGFSREEYEAMQNSGKTWHGWGKMLMEQLGLIQPIR